MIFFLTLNHKYIIFIVYPPLLSTLIYPADAIVTESCSQSLIQTALKAEIRDQWVRLGKPSSSSSMGMRKTTTQSSQPHQLHNSIYNQTTPGQCLNNSRMVVVLTQTRIVHRRLWQSQSDDGCVTQSAIVHHEWWWHSSVGCSES